MKKIILAIVLMLISSTPSQSESESATNFRVSCDPGMLRPGEKIVGFTLRLKCAYVRRISNIPKKWSITVDNYTSEDPNWNTILKGAPSDSSETIGADYFQDFVSIEKLKSLPSERTFDAQLVLFATQHSAKDRIVLVPLRSLKITPESQVH